MARMNDVQIFAAIVMSFAVFAFVCPIAQAQYGTSDSPQQAPAETAAQPLVLHGGLEHSERMDPVAPELQAGAIFTEQSLPRLQPNNEWYWIPAWYAGHKHVDQATILRDYNFANGRLITPNRVVMDRQDLNIGFQQDRNGQIWEFKRAPYSTTVEAANYFTTILVRSRDPVKVTQNLVVIRMVQTSVNVDKRSRRILKTIQEEQINTYVPASAGVMNMQTSIRSFGADGAPQVQENSIRVVATTAAFAPVDMYEGRDLRTLFREYLQSHNLASYLPDSASNDAGTQYPQYPAGNVQAMPTAGMQYQQYPAGNAQAMPANAGMQYQQYPAGNAQAMPANAGTQYQQYPAGNAQAMPSNAGMQYPAANYQSSPAMGSEQSPAGSPQYMPTSNAPSSINPFRLKRNLSPSEAGTANTTYPAPSPLPQETAPAQNSAEAASQGTSPSGSQSEQAPPVAPAR